MRFRMLGRTGVEVSVVSLGTMAFGPWAATDEADCHRMLHRALDAGVNLVDTADAYSGGEAERIVGRALGRRRDEIVLASKFHWPMGGGRNDRGNSRLWIMRAVEGSLRRLRTDHIDLYQVHRPDLEVDVGDTLSALTDLVRQGKVRYLGSSTFPAWHLVEAQWVSQRRGLERLVCEQPAYSILVRAAEVDVLPVAARCGMGVIVWSPLNGGWLTGKYRRDHAPPPASRAARLAREPGDPRFDSSLPGNRRKFDLVARLASTAGGAGVPLACMAVAFTLAHPAVCSSIIGPRTVEQLDELLPAADVTLDAGTLDAIDEIVRPGETVEESDLGWTPPSLAVAARRR
jgi:aryl-alcohol dehydrogenase-like predicted oxidoreductase